ncbi:hypothetical protein M422DRAFT_37935 [Sphaerobolus stellatus SS14]|uniref:Unplaced genomic scaffold SPHSTscaffold_271, whole genome shotgun sequence n=1 Tax=Sphaerobolus stellatus (strain SS14) TaxID=990650 RepID=A0A0C9TD42_SPHS4|nr:hypothetical protein M422DRAFT_37935 [Sphaerobolus stellatus SS14]
MDSLIQLRLISFHSALFGACNQLGSWRTYCAMAGLVQTTASSISQEPRHGLLSFLAQNDSILMCFTSISTPLG